jgi:hypothetical protein
VTKRWIDPFHIVALLVLSRMEVAAVLRPSTFAHLTPPDTLVSAVLSVLVSTVPLLGLAWLHSRNHGLSVVQVFRKQAGAVPGAVYGLLFCGFHLLCAGCTIRHISEVYHATFMHRTPQLIFGIGLAALSIYAGCAGIRVLGRAA